MPLYKLDCPKGKLPDGVLKPAAETAIDVESHLESWLEHSPWAVLEEPLLIIARQASAKTTETTVFPDLLALDADGNLVVIELKKGRAPRDVSAQLLEYAAWAADLSHDEIARIAASYLGIEAMEPDEQLAAMFLETFECEEFPTLGKQLRLVIAAEVIPPSVARVCRFLRSHHGIKLTCLAFSVFRTGSGEILVQSEQIVGAEQGGKPNSSEPSGRWLGDMPVKEVVWQAVELLTGDQPDRIFSPKEVIAAIQEKYPSFNVNTARCQLIADCVNHTSRHHYPGGKDRYWTVGKGRFQLYKPEDLISRPRASVT